MIAPDYCKAPQHPFPAALNQCHALLHWIANPSGLFKFLNDSGTPSIQTFLPHVNLRKIALSGGSSGGNLAAALVVRDQRRESRLPNGAKIVALGLLYPMLDISTPYQEKLATVSDKSKVLPRWLTRLFLDGYLSSLRKEEQAAKLKHPYMSPGLCPTENLQRFPKTVVITAEFDYLRQEGEDFADRLQNEAGFIVVRGDKCDAPRHEDSDNNHSVWPHPETSKKLLWRKTFKGVAHGFDIAPNFTAKSERKNGSARDEAWWMIAEAFDQELSGGKSLLQDGKVHPAAHPNETLDATPTSTTASSDSSG